MKLGPFKKLIFISLLIFGLSGCDSGAAEVEGPKNNEPVNQKENFHVEILNPENNAEMITASITYTGEEKAIDVYHGGNHVLYFNYYKDGKALNTGTRSDMRSKTTLIQNEPLVLDFDESELEEFDAGEVEVEAIAGFGVGEDIANEVEYEISVSTTLSLLD
ncbi:hypothetical protein [Planococcus sp. S3-L1]|uniref:hypothetical protein n=1 Tax=Planococcus sp. S3-L1 TaxID=3046200 RepID=UPI0024B906C5|nr:hypothetical protein [Planococcus sp. S3-L1]MDJ0332704.1 hypothetical protein [Planococcus sp. S3-L1]